MAGNKVECMVSELDIFSPAVVQTCVVSGDWQQFKSVHAISEDGPVIFHIPGQGTSYIDLTKTLLYFRFRVIDGSKNEIYGDDIEYSVINNTLNSMWSEVKVELNQTTVSSANSMNHIRGYLETLFSYNETSKSTHLTSSLFYKDEAGKFNDLTSSGNVARSKFVKGSKVVEVCGPLHTDILNCNKYLLNEIDMRISLTKNPASLVVLGPATLVPKIEILDATLWVRKVQPNPGILVAHAKMLTSNTAKYHVKRVELQNHTISKDIYQKSIESLFLNRLPSRVIIGMVRNSAFSGAVDQSVFNFENFDLNYLALSINSAVVGSAPYKPNYAEKQSILPYLLGFYHVGIGSSDDGYTVNRDEFADGYVLYCFDLTPNLSGSESYWSIPQQGNCRLEMSFAKPMPCVTNLIIYSEFFDTLEIDRDRAIHMQYKA